MKKAGIQTRPVPAPRRLNPEMRAGNYENIEINNSTRNDLNISTDKKLNIDAENFHKSCEEKKLPTSSHVKIILQNKNLEQPIYGPDANEVVLTELLYATPKPAPRQRASPKLLPEEETKHANLAEALSRPLRVAPQVPFSSLNIEIDCGNSERSRICSERSSNNGQLVDDSHFNVSVDFSESAQVTKLKSLSPGYVGFDEEFRGHEQDLNCDSEMDTEAGAEGVARSNQSEQSGSSNDSRNLLRSLGNTSKQIGGSIGERMASKAKGAKTRLDINLRNSTEAICSLSADASHRLRLVGKRLGANFTLGKQENKTTELGALLGLPQETEQERRRTMPSSDIFNTIQFSSPLNHSAAVGYYTDLSDHRELSHGLPEPKPHSLSQLKAKPPSYDEALRSRSSPTFPPAKKPLDASAQNVQLQNHYHHHHQQERQCSSGDSPYREPIMATHPPPLLFQQLDALLPPSHQERRKNYENIRQFPLNVELQKLNRVPASPKSEQSLLNSTKIAEAQIYKPEIPDSWHFYSDAAAEPEPHPTASPGVKVEYDFSFFPESVYANQEATYIKLFEMGTSSTSDDKLVTSQLDPACVKEDGELNSYDGAVGGWSASLVHTMPPPLELIEEFDPLMRKSLTLSRSNKSNELLLLEHLLEEDTYGVIKRDQDDLSMCASEENDRIDAAAASTLTEIKNINKSGIKNNVQIVHQNSQLLGDSMENILNEAHPLDLDTTDLQSWPRHSRMEKNLGKPFVDLATPSRNRTNWFVGDKVQIEGDSPPTYLEAIGGDAQPVTSASSATPLAASANSESSETRSKLGSRFRQTMNAFSNVKMRMDAMRTSFKGGAQRQADEKVALQMVPRPCLSPLLVRYEGSLVRFPSGVVEDILKEMQNRKVVLRDRHFQTFVDQEMRTPKETIPLDSITTVQCVSNSRITDSATHFYCFEMTTSLPKNSSAVGIESTSSNPNVLLTSYSNVNFKQQRVAYLYGVGKESERGIWMQKILESLTNIVPVKYTCHFYRAGWCYLKNSISSEWSGTWLVLRKNQRRLIFVSESNGNVEKMDLRKARCIVLKESDESTDNLYVERGPMLMIDCPPYTVYTIMSSARETKIWRHIIREVAHNNGFSLGDQQLTRYDVPVIVDKCINFVYIHGSMSEGIYRKSGSENSMQKLISAFRADAFNVEITRNEYNEHDVANVLKRFMRDLPERLLGKLTDSFVFVTELAVASEKIPIYKELLSRLSFIERETLRRIVSHLVFISSQQARNKMSVQNLAIIWGPTLLAKKCDELVYSQKEADVLSDLIVLYTNLFPCSADETKKEKAMLMCLQKYYAAAETLKDAVKQSGDIKMWISLNPNPNITTEEKTQVNATISPTKTAYELCREYSEKMQKPSHELTLYEVILNDSLERPLHHDAKVFEVILNWSYWPEEDRKHNYLVVRPIEMLRDVQKAVNNLGTVTPSKELRFADYRTKTFKTLQCELRDGKIIVSKKDKLEKTTIVREIFLHSCTAYLGCERKRDFSLSWAITFVERTQSQIMRSRDAPFIGHVLAGREWVDRTIWYSSIWYCLHGDHILPPVDVILS